MEALDSAAKKIKSLLTNKEVRYKYSYGMSIPDLLPPPTQINSMKSKSLLNKIDTILAAGLLTASIVVAPSAQAADWTGANANWSSNGNPGWNGTGVPNAVGAVANHGVSTTSVTTVDSSVTVGTIALTNNSNHRWTITLTNGITLDQDGAGSGNATISNTNTAVNTTNGLNFDGGTLTLADNLLISNTGASTRTATNGGAIQFGTTAGTTSVIAGSGNITIDNVLNDTVAGAGCIRFGGNTNTFTGNVNVRSGGTMYGGGSAFGGVATNVITLGASGAGSASLLATAGGTVVNNWVVAAGSGGTLTLGSINTNGVTWSGTGTLNSNLTFLTGASSAGSGFKLDGVISGTGNFTMSSAGAGYATMTNANTYTGSTSVSSGILNLTNVLALQNSALDTTASVTGNATAGLRAGGVTTLTLGGLTGNKNLADVFATGAGASAGLYSAVTALTLNPGTGVTHTYSAGIANGAANMKLTKMGLGTQILEGTNTYTGTTTVSTGTLIINGNQTAATGNVSVSNGATLGGNGTIGGATTLDSGGILSPGNSPGTLAFSSNLTLTGGVGAAGATAIFEGGDLVTVNGTLTLNTDWNLTLTSGFQNGGTTTLFNYTTAGATLDLTPDFDITGLGFTPSSSLFLTDTGSSIVLNGISVVPEPSTFALLAASLTTIMVLRRRRRS